MQDFRRSSAELFARPVSGRGTGQVGVDEAVDIAVHDGVNVGTFIARPRVLGQRLGHKDIAPDLAAPFDLMLHALDVRDFFQMFPLLDLQQLGAQHPHTGLHVL